jgi:hypothetical protein
MPPSDQDEGSNWTNVLNAQEGFLEDARDIRIWNNIKTTGLS